MRKAIATLFLIAVFVFILVTVFYSFAQETITLTTYYPAPYGIYRELRANQMSIGEGFRNSPLSAGMLIVEGDVGIGTSAPSGPFEVAGGQADSGAGRNITIEAEDATGNGNGGNILLIPGEGAGSGDDGDVIIGRSGMIPGVQRLDIYGTLRVRDNAQQIRIFDADASDPQDFFTVQKDIGRLGIGFYDNSAGTMTQLLTGTTDGKVGIGLQISDPLAKLHVQSNDVDHTAIRLENEQSNHAIWELRALQTPIDISNSFAIWGGREGGSFDYRLIIEPERGNVGIGTISSLDLSGAKLMVKSIDDPSHFVSIYGYKQGRGSHSLYGVEGVVFDGKVGYTHYGVRGYANITQGEARAVSGLSLGNNPGGKNIGIHGKAVNSGENWAGYFEDGNNYFKDKVLIGTTISSSPIPKLEVQGSNQKAILAETASNAAAIHGKNNGNGAGVRGESTTNGRGVFAKSKDGYSLYVDSTTAQYCAWFEEDIAIDGVIHGRGWQNLSSIIQPHPFDPTKQLHYVELQGRDNRVFFDGTTSLKNGKAVIEIPEDFRYIASKKKPLNVILTPFGEAQLYVKERSFEKIVVNSIDGKDVEFGYMVIAAQLGFEESRPIEENTIFRPDEHTTVERFENKGKIKESDSYYDRLRKQTYQSLLMQNGILNKDGTINMNLVKKLSWEYKKGEELAKAKE